MNISFSKYQGTGNDFIMIDNRSGELQLSLEQVKFLCDRRFGIGADGLILFNNKEGYDFEMKYYNADGGESTMCGNGGRCIVQFAYDLGMHRDTYNFVAIDGPHEATFEEKNWIHLKMKDVSEVQIVDGNFILNTGSPHYVKYVDSVKDYPVADVGRKIRFSKDFIAKGINVNLVEFMDHNIIYVRTYERGVEDETLSCGTGVTASALISAHNDSGFNHIDVVTPGGKLAVEFNKISDHSFDDIWLCGPATFVYKGSITIT